MEVYLESFGERRPVAVEAETTVSELKQHARREFGYGEVELNVIVEGSVVEDWEVVAKLGVMNGDVLSVQLGKFVPRRLLAWVGVENVRCVAISDRLLVAVGVAASTPSVSLYDANPASKQPLVTLRVSAAPTSLAFSPCSTYLIATTNTSTHTWRVPTGDVTYSATAAQVTFGVQAAHYFVWSTRDTTKFIGYDGAHVFAFDFGGCSAAAGPDDVVAVASFSKTVRVLTCGKDAVSVAASFEVCSLVAAMVVLDDVLVMLCGCTAKVFCLKHRAMVQMLNPHPYTSQLAASQLCNTVVITKGRSVSLTDRNLATKVTAPTSSLTQSLTVPILAPYFITVGHSDTRIHDLATGCELATLDIGAAVAVSATSTGTHIVTAARRGISIWH